MKINLENITTEQANKDTKNIDLISTMDAVKLINGQDKKVASAVKKEIKNIAYAVDITTEAIKNGGRVIYFGAGTSGRLGILDASEILPTYGEAEWFIGLIAGGPDAIITPVENAEDSKIEAIKQFKKLKITKNDVVIGIAASGRTPYVVYGLKFAKENGIKAISISTSKNTEISKHVNVAIEAVVGPETIMGSTRMKSGTAQKMILNIISTLTAVKMGKVYENKMVDLVSTNAKLIERARNLVMSISGADYSTAKNTLNKAKGNVKTAIVMVSKNINFKEATKLLNASNGVLRKII